MRIRRHLADVLAVALLLILTIAFYRKVSFTNAAFVGLDAFTYFYPQESYLADSLRQGHLPLWNPYIFTGVPFLANMQTAVFYPLNLIFLILPIPRAYAYSVILHVFLTGLFAFTLCRVRLGLSRTASLAGAITLMFSGFFNSLVGHINQLHVATWAPLLFLLCDIAISRKSIRASAVAAIVLALQFTAGHAQEFYLTIIGLIIYTVACVLPSTIYPHSSGQKKTTAHYTNRFPDFSATGDNPGARSPVQVLYRLSRLYQLAISFGILAFIVQLGLVLAAAQLLPTLELSAVSIRAGGMSYKEATSFSLPPWLLLQSLLPVFSDPQPFSEWLGYVGVFGLTLAIFATATSPRSEHKVFAIFTMLIALFFALGQFNPLYYAAYKIVPGISFFRVPARWIYLYTIAASLLVAYGVEALKGVTESANRAIIVRFLLVGGTVASILSVPYVALANTTTPGLPSLETKLIWLASLVAALATVTLAVFAKKDVRLIAVVAIVAELFTASQWLDINRTTLAEVFSTIRPAIAHLLADNDTYRVLAVSENTYDPGDMREIKEMLQSVLSEKEIYDYLVATKWKETLQPNLPIQHRIATLDGYDGGLLPLRSYLELKKLFPLRDKQAPDGRLREELERIPDIDVLGMLNVKYVLLDRVQDVWIDGIYYDLALSQTLSTSDSALKLEHFRPFETTAIGLVSHLSGAEAVPDDRIVAWVKVTDLHNQAIYFPLRTGTDTAEADRSKAVAHNQARKAKAWKDNANAWDYFTKIELPSPTEVKSIEITRAAIEGELVIRAISLIDERTQTSIPIPISPAIEISHLGDVKIYRNRNVWPRAFIARAVDTGSTYSAFQQSGRLIQIDTVDRGSILAERSSGQAQISSYQPERVTIAVKSAESSYLVLTDAYYPGWRALVDGRDQPVLLANKHFRAVAIEPGEHTIEFVYDPLSVKIGALISTLAASAVIGLCFSPMIARRLTTNSNKR